jgi:TolB protein
MAGNCWYGRRTVQGNLWRIDLAQKKARPLTSGTLQITWPDVSPDGQWIAATEGPDSDSVLVRIPMAGGEPVRLGEGARPVWAPDGRRLAFVSRRSGSPRVWITRADVEWREEVKDSAVGQWPPIWLPDGRLAWQTTDHTNYRIRDLETGREELWRTSASRKSWNSST